MRADAGDVSQRHDMWVRWFDSTMWRVNVSQAPV